MNLSFILKTDLPNEHDSHAGNKVMYYMTLITLIIGLFLLIDPCKTAAFQVNKNSVVLDKVSELKISTGDLIGKEKIYIGGMSGDSTTQQDSVGHTAEIRLREIHSGKSAFTLNKGSRKIGVKVIPLVEVRDQNGAWRPSVGRWDYNLGETRTYISAIHVRMGGDLDFAYQSTGMKVGEKENVLHYGLTGNPHAISLSRKRLKAMFPPEKFSDKKKPILNYQPSPNIILVHLKLTSDGLILKPIFDYQVVSN